MVKPWRSYKKIRDGIYEKRRATQPLSKQLQQGKQSLKSTAQAKVKNFLQPPWKKLS